MNRNYHAVAVVLATVTMCAPVFASATFNVRPTSGEPGLAPFVVDVSEASGGKALFTLRTIDPEGPWGIEGAYFYDGVLLGIDEPTVGLYDAGSYGHLNGVDLDKYKLVTAYVSAGNSSQSTLGVLFSLHEGETYDNVVAGINDGTILIGIEGKHADGNQHFVAVPAVPAPGALLLSGIGAGCVALFRRRKAA